MWLWAITRVPLLLTEVAHCFFQCVTAANWWLYVVSGFTLPLTWMALCIPRFPVASHCSGFTLFLMSCCCSLKWHHMTEVVLLLYCSSLESSQISYCCSIRKFCIIPSVPLLLMGVVLCHTKWTICAHWDGSNSFQLFDCRSPRLICTALGVPLSITRVALCHLRCPTNTY